MFESLPFFQDLGLALLMGSLIGLERERNHKDSAESHAFGGLRTMALVSMYGFLAYRLFFDDTLIFAFLSGAYFSLVVASYVISSIQNKNSGATTEIAGLFAYLIGILMAMGAVGKLYATVITLLVVLIMYFKRSLHRFAHHIGNEELYDTLKFVAVVFVVLPLLPNQFYGPLDVFNPYEIWFVVVLICSISFASYVGIKLLGPKKGIGVGGFLGGLISSTAVALSFSHLSKKSKIVDPFVFGILVASSAMFIRVLLTISVLHSPLMDSLTVPLIAMSGVGFLMAAYFWFRKGRQKTEVTPQELDMKTPFELGAALQFAILFAALLFASKFAAVSFGEWGLYVTAFFSGTFDVDAITISMAHLAMSQNISNDTASLGVLIAVLTNTLSKGVLVAFLASREVGRRTILCMMLMVLVGCGVFFLIPSADGAFAF